MKYEELTVGKLKSTMENLPDDSVVRISSDTGVNHGSDGPVIVENAYVTGSKKKVLNIYVNEKIEDPIDDYCYD